jgi:hypothetical protein
MSILYGYPAVPTDKKFCPVVARQDGDLCSRPARFQRTDGIWVCDWHKDGEFKFPGTK